MLIEITRKKVFIILSLLLVLVAVPLTVYLSQRQQDPRTRASEESTDTSVVATFDGQQITKGEVRDVALEYYEPAAVDGQALKDALLILAERKILDKQSQALGINAEPSEIDQKVQNEGLSETDAFYEVLKHKIILSEVKSREALTIDFWSPTEEALASLTEEERAQAAKELSDGIPALREGEAKLKAGEDVLKVGNDLLAKYPSLVDALALNGYILSGITPEETQSVLVPNVFEYGDSPLDQTTNDELFAMEVGDVKLVTGTETNRGGVLFKLVSRGNDSGALSYQAWLQSMMLELFRDLGQL